MILMFFYAMEYKTDPSKQGIVRMCVFVLQTLSTEPNFGKLLNKDFEEQDVLPAVIKLNDFRGTYADFLLIVSVDCRNLEVMLIGAVNSYPHHLEQWKVGFYISVIACHYQ